MKQQERLDFLLEKLKEDSVQYKNLQVEENETAKKEAVRSLMNIRMPRYIDRKILKVQDEFLQNQTFEKGIVTLDMIATVYKGNIIKNLIMDCQSYTKYRPNETTGGIFVSWRRKEELPTGA